MLSAPSRRLTALQAACVCRGAIHRALAVQYAEGRDESRPYKVLSNTVISPQQGGVGMTIDRIVGAEAPKRTPWPGRQYYLPEEEYLGDADHLFA